MTVYYCEECEDTGYARDFCDVCAGSGEGYYDGSTCLGCKGSGMAYYVCKCKQAQGDYND